MPTYNRANLLPRAIQSVIDQTFKDWELIIIDDGSTKGIGDDIAGYNDDRIRYYWQDNCGRSDARNKGLSLAEGDYICFLDDDDWFLEIHLGVLHKSILASGSSVILKTGAKVYEKNTYKNEALIGTSRLSSVEYIWLNGVSLFQLAIPRSILGDTAFDMSISYGEDLLWVGKLLLKDNVQLKEIEEYTVVINNHQDRSSYSNSKAGIIRRYHNILFVRHSLLDEGFNSVLDANIITQKMANNKKSTIVALLKSGFVLSALGLLFE